MASSDTRSSTSGAKKASPKKASPKKASPKKASSRKSSSTSTAEKSSPRKTSTRKASTKKASAKAQARPDARAGHVATQATAELLELTGKGVEGVTGLERTDDGWTVQIEVIEVRRIPDTTDVLALYEVTTDRQGSLLGYRRLRRYARGVPGND